MIHDIFIGFQPIADDQISPTEFAPCCRSIGPGWEPLSASLWQSPDLSRLLPDLDHDQVWVEDTPGSALVRFNVYLFLYITFIRIELTAYEICTHVQRPGR